MSEKELIELGKKKAATKAVDENVKKDMILGIGSGSTVVYAVNRIAELNREQNLNLKCIPTSFQSYQLIVENGLTLVSLDQYPEIDLDIDGADEIDSNLNLIKGGGGCLVQEKIIASNSKKLVIIADFRKYSKLLGENWKKGVPIEVIPLSYVPIMRKLEKMGGKPKLRMAKSKAGPLVSDNGNFIVDVDFGVIKDPSELNNRLLVIPGIVDTGFFIGMTKKAYIGQKDGSVIIKK
ncbi:MAG: ribose 5-phosphate isomerase A [Candidatus Lokiarchaeota archaeon]|nr:ribose 5-phosphate isomerase A [Candidatus Lokiarchaeota archaeon]MBD3199656.1 ribose 5-phosphate isomerase A [Candidatus Lokiarchaeota archaeon]